MIIIDNAYLSFCDNCNNNAEYSISARKTFNESDAKRISLCKSCMEDLAFLLKEYGEQEYDDAWDD